MPSGGRENEHAPALAPAPATRWALLRLGLGVAQMTSALASFVWLIGSGVSSWSLAAVAVTCLLTTVSVMLFGDHRRRTGPGRALR